MKTFTPMLPMSRDRIFGGEILPFFRGCRVGSKGGMKVYPPKYNRAFSLVEILTVLTLVALVTSFSIPAFNSLGGSRNMAAGIYEVSGLLEFARNEALARQTYVWVGFQQV